MSRPEDTRPVKARPPAWSGLKPDDSPALQPVSAVMAANICRTIGRQGRLLARKPLQVASENYFVFEPNDRAQRLFLKTVDGQRLDSQLSADRIARWLADRGLPVSAMLHGYPRPLQGDRHLLAYARIEGRFARPVADELFACGSLLARVHHHLRELPWADQVRHSSLQRDRRFRQLHASQLNSKHTPARVRELLMQQGPELPDEQAQALHGDLNLGNLLLCRDTGRAYLLDFEDAVHNWHSPLVDLAMMLERFVLAASGDDDLLAEQLGNALIDGYREQTTLIPAATCPPERILQALAIRALLLLGNTSGQASIQPERDKFITLFEQAQHRRLLLWDLWLRLADGD